MCDSAELEQSSAVMMANTGDSTATILKNYAKLPEVVMRRFVENKPVIPSERVLGVSTNLTYYRLSVPLCSIPR
jgi:hypothetical protein